MTLRDPRSLPDLPRDADGPVFAEPWQAQAFAMAVLLHERGIFTWPEWAAALAAELRADAARAPDDHGATYYRSWLAALERLCVAKGIVSNDGIARLATAWRAAAEATPHGRPIVLPAEAAEAQSAAKQ